MEATVRSLVSDELYASGIPSFEDEINYYVLRYANYKKCVNGRALLLEAMDLARKKLESKEKRLKRKKEGEQATIRTKLLGKMHEVKPSSIDIYDIARKYDLDLKALDVKADDIMDFIDEQSL